ncbi:UDP-glycosyltransferase 87A2-like [Carex rostrata]
MAPNMTGQVPFHMAAIAFPGRGNINAMMNFCRLLSDHGSFLISFVVSEEWHSILSSDLPPQPCVQLCTIPDCIPSERGCAADYNGFLQVVLTKMEEPFELLIIQQLETPVQAIVSESFLPWVVAVGNRRAIPVFSLFPMAARFFLAMDNCDMLPVQVQTADLIAVHAGIPMLTFPIFLDQDADSRLIVEKWKVGVSLKGKKGNDDIVWKEDIAKVVKEFMKFGLI